MYGLAREQFPKGAVKVTGTEFWRIRVGDLRVVYAIDVAQRLIVVQRVARRNEATYRRIRETTDVIGG